MDYCLVVLVIFSAMMYHLVEVPVSIYAMKRVYPLIIAWKIILRNFGVDHKVTTEEKMKSSEECMNKGRVMVVSAARVVRTMEVAVAVAVVAVVVAVAVEVVEDL